VFGYRCCDKRGGWVEKDNLSGVVIEEITYINGKKREDNVKEKLTHPLGGHIGPQAESSPIIGIIHLFAVLES
jgi:hypothetical protein